MTALTNAVIASQMENHKDLLNYRQQVFQLYPEVAAATQFQACKTIVLTLSAGKINFNTDKKVYKKIINDGQVDALRHFIFTAMIAKKVGVHKARMIMNAHEDIDPDMSIKIVQKNPDLSVQSKMDLHNNNQALQWVANAGIPAGQLTDEQIYKAALNYLKEARLQILKNDNSFCNTEQIHQVSWAQVKADYKKIMKEYQKFQDFACDYQSLARPYDLFTTNGPTADNL